jgi:hypothetical protein
MARGTRLAEFLQFGRPGPSIIKAAQLAQIGSRGVRFLRA